MRSYLSVACATLLASNAAAFTARTNNGAAVERTSALNMAEGQDRRAFFSNVAAAAGAVATANFLQIQPANALGGGIKKVNAKLAGLGLPEMRDLPSGFTPLCELWGKGPNRFPLLVNFAHPADWVVSVPSMDLNGEDGTVQAGEYGKGDTATFFVYEEAGNVPDIASQDKAFFTNVLQKAISQKSANIYQNFKVKKIVETKGEYKDQTYMIVDFQYQLITGAGFEVDRKAVASVTSQGKAVEVLWCAATDLRYNKKLQAVLRDIAASFRVYSDGLDILVPKVKVEEY